jgi:hypothetical protein
MAGLPMMPWFPRDFLAATRGWPLIARAVYRELLDAQWDMGTLAIATPLLQQMSGATVAEFEIAWAFVEAKFPVVEGGRQNPTLELHRQKALQLKEKRAKSGQKGGMSKALAIANQLLGNCSSLAVANLYHPSPSPSPSPSETSQSLVSGSTKVARAPLATRLPRDFALDGNRIAYAISQGLDPERVLESFRDYWLAASGAKARKHDWDATWRTWCRTESTRPPRPGTKLVSKAKSVTQLEQEERDEQQRSLGV